MTEMEKRVAEAIDSAEEADLDFKADWPAEALARAAIAAMREPTQEMIEAMENECVMQFGVKTGAISIWEAGIHAALNAKKLPPRD